MNTGRKGTKGSRLFILAVLIALSAALLTACAAVDEALREEELAALKESGTFQTGVSVEGVDIGGLTYSEALTRLEDAEKRIRDSLAIEVRFGGISDHLRAGDGFDVCFNTEDVLEQAILIGRGRSAARLNMAQRAMAMAHADQYALKLSYTVETDPLAEKVNRWAQAYDRLPVDATATPLTKPDANKSKTGTSANTAEGQEGYFKYTEGQNGMTLRQEELTALLRTKLENGDFTPADAPFDTEAPRMNTDQLKKITVLVASFTTKFKGSPLDRANRVYNIAKAAGLINAMTVLPGEEFSINAALGPRTTGGGWKLAPGIENGQYTDQAGGGVCQVSTTLFNAVLMADIDVKTMKRSHHSWPSSYVDIGRDATISTGAPDFCFINSKTTPLYIFTTVDKNQKTITVEIFGEPLPEGMKIKITSKQLTSTPPSPRVEYRMDSSLPKGTVKEARPAHNRKTSVTYREYWQDGKLVKKVQLFSDIYRAFPQLILYAKGTDPTASPEQSTPPSTAPSSILSAGLNG